MTIHARIEGRRVETKLSSGIDADPTYRLRYAKAERGSRRLRNAIWKLQGIEPPKVNPRAPEPRPAQCSHCLSPLAPKRHLIADIQRTIAAYYGFPINQLISADRRRELTHARQVAMYLANELTEHSIAEIGRRFKRDHTTVLHALKAVPERAERNPDVAFDITLLRERLTA